MIRLVEPTSGEVRILGKDILPLSKTPMHEHRRHAHIILQDLFVDCRERWALGQYWAEINTRPLFVCRDYG